jgi:dolichyl-phosphate beta-glucosyltransferase
MVFAVGFPPISVSNLSHKTEIGVIRARLRKSISIVIPAFNEEKRLPATLGKIRAYLDATEWEFAEIVVVNDGSRDGTAGLARRFGARVLENPGNCGKGYSVRHGMLEAQGDWVLFTDADLSSPIEGLDKLFAAVERGQVQAAIGSRTVDPSLIGVRQPLFREYMGRLFNLMMRAITGLPFGDTQCGFKLFEAAAAREIFRRQRLEGFGFDVEVLFIAMRLGYRTVEVPVCWNDVAGSKVSMWRGAAAFLDPLKVRWNGIVGRYGRVQIGFGKKIGSGGANLP